MRYLTFDEIKSLAHFMHRLVLLYMPAKDQVHMSFKAPHLFFLNLYTIYEV